MQMRFITLLAIVLVAGCATPVYPPHARPEERGPDGTIAYYVEIESEPGVKMELNNEFVGTTPCRIKIWGNRNGKFHNFSNPIHTIRAYPTKSGQWVQTKTFGAGGFMTFVPEDRIPEKIYFDVNIQSAEPVKTINVNVNKTQ